MANPLNIMAAMQAAGVAGTSLVWARNAGDAGGALPTSASAAIDPSFVDMGNCDSKGANIKSNPSSTPIKSFGSIFPQGNLFTDFAGTVDVTFQETTPNTVAMYRGMPLGSITQGADGSFGTAISTPQDVRYQLVLDGFSQNGSAMRFVIPNCSNTNPGDFNMQMGQVLDRPVTFTMYPDASGNLFYEYYVVKGASGVLVTPSTKTLSLAGTKTQQLTVMSGSTNVTSSATYTSSTPAVASVNSAGLVTGLAAGTTTVTATYQGKTSNCIVTVTA